MHDFVVEPPSPTPVPAILCSFPSILHASFHDCLTLRTNNGQSTCSAAETSGIHKGFQSEEASRGEFLLKFTRKVVRSEKRSCVNSNRICHVKSSKSRAYVFISFRARYSASGANRFFFPFHVRVETTSSPVRHRFEYSTA